MAQRRMFSLKVINSARFLKMPVDSRELYFQLGLHADDDGIVEAYPILKLTGSSDDNLRVLVAKNFIKILNDDLVSFIVDWNEHNLIRADRKVDSIYKHLLLKIVPEAEIVEPKPRADTGKITGRQLDVNWTPQDSIGKDSIGKDNTYSHFEKNDNICNNLLNYWNTKNIIQHRKVNDKLKRKINIALKNYEYNEIQQAIDNYAGILANNQLYFFSYRWGLGDFLQRGLEKFLTSAMPFENFKKKPFEKISKQDYEKAEKEKQKDIINQTLHNQLNEFKKKLNEDELNKLDKFIGYYGVELAINKIKRERGEL